MTINTTSIQLNLNHTCGFSSCLNIRLWLTKKNQEVLISVICQFWWWVTHLFTFDSLSIVPLVLLSVTHLISYGKDSDLSK